MVKKFITFFCLLAYSLAYGQFTDSNRVMITFIEKAPFFDGDLKEFIQNKIEYPLDAKKDSIEGTVFISFKIDTLGITYNHKVVRGVREDLDNEAIRVTKLIFFKRPAMQRGKPIEVEIIVPVNFYLGRVEKKSKCSKNDKILPIAQ
jgi:protein TonB